ncbi:hypothetical protein LCGC14_0369640 [marine sediment metagenome]|uniref:Uncharacterized protein n=1 Tax=marine sediment metagenome TaxID=412755 RepID=A0A0F9T5F6_9ZZZZ
MEHRMTGDELRDAILAIISFGAYSGLGLEEYYMTPAENYTAEGMEEALGVTNQILALCSEHYREQERKRISEWGIESCVHEVNFYRKRECPECWKTLKGE